MFEEISHEINRQFCYIKEKFKDKSYYDSSLNRVIDEINEDRLRIVESLDSDDEDRVNNIIKYDCFQKLEDYQNMYNSSFASEYFVRDVFNISSYDLNNAFDELNNKFSNIRDELNGYIASNSSNEHFSYPVKRARELIGVIDVKLEDVRRQCERLCSKNNAKINIMGYNFTNLDVNDEYFHFLEEVGQLIVEYEGLKNSILESLPH